MNKQDTIAADKGTLDPLVGILNPGDVLIPACGYSYCLRVDKLWPGCSDDGTQLVECTRYDLSEDRQPVYEHARTLHCCDLYAVTPDVFRENPESQRWRWPHRPEYFRKWKPKTGQLCLF